MLASMALFGAAARASVLGLVCPHCAEAQVRARKPAGAQYACKRCHRRFTREQGLAAARAKAR
jgi:transposase-like protein